MNWYYQLNDKRNWIKVWKDKDGNLQKEQADFALSGNWQPGDIIEITHHPLDGADEKTPTLFKPPPYPKYENVKTRTLDELIEELKKLPVPPFKPWTNYNPWFPGGMIEVVWKDAAYYVDYETENKHLAYCKSFENDEIVGIHIENVANLKLK